MATVRNKKMSDISITYDSANKAPPPASGKKTLQANSRYAKYDIDGDGEVTDEEMAKIDHMIESENKEKKEAQLRKMAWVAMLSMVFFTLILFTPFTDVARITALGSVLQMFYVAQAGVVATFFGASAYIAGK
jgi:hypothetical protein